MTSNSIEFEAFRAVPEITEISVLTETLAAELVITPPAPFLAEGFPVERVRLELRSSGREPKVFPLEDVQRPWRHRYNDGSLCMWHPRDTPALRWVKVDGEEMLGRIIVRHLVYEECWRRTGEWPVEDSAHLKGGRNRYRPLAIRTKEMRMARKTWSR